MVKRLLNKFIALFFSSLISVQCFAYEDVKFDNVAYSYVDGHACAHGNSLLAGDIILRDKVTFHELVWENGEQIDKPVEVYVTEVDRFNNNIKITSVTANHITNIASSTFSGCTSLKSVMLGNSLVKIGDWAFHGCTALEKINLPAGLTSIGANCFNGCNSLFSSSTLKIPSSVTSVGERAFLGSGVKEVDWATQVAVPKSAFNGCKNLASINLHQTCGISDDAFSGCTSLESIAIPQSCTTIGSRAFRGCSALTYVFLHKYFTTIGNYAFAESGITKLEISEGCENLTIGEDAFFKCLELSRVIFYDSKKIVIQRGAFRLNNKLEYLHLAKGITEIGPDNFNACMLLKDFELPNTIEQIGGTLVDNRGNVYYGGCFSSCPLLTKIDLPENIEGKKIYLYDSFDRCDNLITVTLAPGQVYEYFTSFDDCPNLNEIVPRKSTAKSVISRTQRANEVSIVRGGFLNCPELERFECVFIVEGQAFTDCPKLKFDSYHIKYTETVPSYAAPGCYVRNVTMPASVREIDCDGVPNAGTVTIPDSLRIIHKHAINVSEMSEIVLPDSLHTVYEACIRGGSGVLNKLTLKSKIPPVFLKNDGTPYTIEEIENTYPKRTIVRDAESIPLYVPKGTAEAYRKAPGWHLFTEIIEYGEISAIDDVAISASTVTVEGGRIVVAGSVPVTIFNMSGTMIYNGISERIPALPKGFYIVNVAGTATKVSI